MINLAEENPILRINEISKSFGTIQALKSASLEIEQGEIVAILGDNGSGKSTLVKILSGDEAPDSGSIEINGILFKKITPKKALSQGVSTVYQDLAIDNLRNTPRNIFLGRELLKFKFLFDDHKMLEETQKLLLKLNIKIPDMNVPVGCLSGGQRQSIAIARAIYGDNKFIILDEPTAAMGVNETEAFLVLVKSLKKLHKGILLISHNIEQVYSLADRVYVMRQGILSKPYTIKNHTADSLRSLVMRKGGSHED